VWEEPTVTGTVAGIIAGLSFTETEVQLRDGDTVLLYTDGVDEARGREGFFGHERLRVLLPEYARAGPATLCEAVEQRVLEHLDGAAHDDIALIAAQTGTGATCPSPRRPRPAVAARRCSARSSTSWPWVTPPRPWRSWNGLSTPVRSRCRCCARSSRPRSIGWGRRGRPGGGRWPRSTSPRVSRSPR